MARPPKYKSEEELVVKIDEFFAKCVAEQSLPEKAGLCLHLHIVRDTWNDWRKKPQYSATIKATDLRIESAWVKRLNGQAATGAIFYLKNAFKEEYKDRVDTDITSGGKPILQVTGMKISKE